MDARQFFQQLMSRPVAWRLFLAALVVVPLLLVLPHARSLVVRNAVVTAYLSDLRAPIDGEVVAVDLLPGETPAPGLTAIMIENERLSRSHVARLEVMSEAAEGVRNHLAASLNVLREMAGVRETQATTYSLSIERDLESRKQQLADESRALQSALAAAESELQRVRGLQESQLMSAADLERAEAQYESARAAQQVNRQDQLRVDSQLEEVRAGVFEVAVPDGAMLTRQMDQELRLQLMEAERALRMADAEWRASEAEYRAALSAYESQARAGVSVPPGKTVFDIYTSVGGWVQAGNRVMSVVDCSALMVDIAIDDAILEMIRPGHEVRVRLFGTLDYLPARVVLVRGSAGLDDTPVLAASVNTRGQREGRVLAAIDAPDLEDLPEKTCGIGRAAYAEFEDIGLFTLMFHPLLR